MSTLSDSELSRLVAEKVAGMYPPKDDRSFWMAANGEIQLRGLPPFATSADAVLPLLERCSQWNNEFVGYDSDVNERHYCRVWVLNGNGVDMLLAKAPTFARAACLALLKAAGVELQA